MNELPIGPPIEGGALMPWKIVALAKRKHEFNVSWRYRDHRLMARCRKLVRQGWLRCVHSKPGSTCFVPGRLCDEPARD